jgi:type IV secretion system protein VirB1
VLPDMDVMSCRDLAVPIGVMQHVVRVESSFNRYAIGVVGGRLARQPSNLPEALATARMLRERGFNFSLGLAQVNRYNLGKYGLSLEGAFQACPNLQAGAKILSDCFARSGNDWGKSLSCYYSGNFVTGFRDGYVQKVFASMRAGTAAVPAKAGRAIPFVSHLQTPTLARPSHLAVEPAHPGLVARRIAADSNDAAGPATMAIAMQGTPPASPAAVRIADPSATTLRVADVPPAVRSDAAFVF